MGWGTGLDFICNIAGPSERPPGTPRSLRLSGGGRHAARPPPPSSPPARERELPSWRTAARGRSEHAQLGGPAAGEAAASAPIRRSGFSRPQRAQPAAPAAGTGPGVRPGEERGAPGPRSRPPRPLLRPLSPWPGLETSPAPGVRKEGVTPRGRPYPPARPLSARCGACAPRCWATYRGTARPERRGRAGPCPRDPGESAPGKLRLPLAKNDGCPLRSLQ